MNMGGWSIEPKKGVHEVAKTSLDSSQSARRHETGYGKEGDNPTRLWKANLRGYLDYPDSFNRRIKGERAL